MRGWIYYGRPGSYRKNGFWRGLIVWTLGAFFMIAILLAIPFFVITNLLDLIDRERE